MGMDADRLCALRAERRRQAIQPDAPPPPVRSHIEPPPSSRPRVLPSDSEEQAEVRGHPPHADKRPMQGESSGREHAGQSRKRHRGGPRNPAPASTVTPSKGYSPSSSSVSEVSSLVLDAIHDHELEKMIDDCAAKFDAEMATAACRLRKSKRVQAQLHKRFVNKKLEAAELRDKLKVALEASKEEQTSRAAEREAWEVERRKWAEERRAWEATLSTQLDEARNQCRQDALTEVGPKIAALEGKVKDLEAALEVAREQAILDFQDSTEATTWALDSMESMLEEN